MCRDRLRNNTMSSPKHTPVTSPVASVTDPSDEGSPPPPEPAGPLRVPGFGMPVVDGDKTDFKTPWANAWTSEGITQREKRMMAFVSSISDKPEWERKVFDETIVEKWRAEADVRPENLEGDVMLSQKMFDFVSLQREFVRWG